MFNNVLVVVCNWIHTSMGWTEIVVAHWSRVAPSSWWRFASAVVVYHTHTLWGIYTVITCVAYDDTASQPFNSIYWTNTQASRYSSSHYQFLTLLLTEPHKTMMPTQTMEEENSSMHRQTEMSLWCFSLLSCSSCFFVFFVRQDVMTQLVLTRNTVHANCNSLGTMMSLKRNSYDAQCTHDMCQSSPLSMRTLINFWIIQQLRNTGSEVQGFFISNSGITSFTLSIIMKPTSFFKENKSPTDGFSKLSLKLLYMERTEIWTKTNIFGNNKQGSQNVHCRRFNSWSFLPLQALATFPNPSTV